MTIRVSPTGDVTGIDNADPSSVSGRLLIPGFANAHSHAFQRALRGQTQRRSPAGRDDFWSWREAMYAVADALDPDTIHTISAMAFLDMLRAGFTSVGEFHYVHNAEGGARYDDPNAMAKAVVAAAERVGIRIALLQVAYAAGGFGQPPNSRQLRFVDPTVDNWLQRTDDLSTWAAPRPRVSVGIAPHSVRAVPIDWLQAIDAWRPEGMPCHMHLSEQRAEVEAAAEHHGRSPLGIVTDHTDLVDDAFTAVHATWFDDADLDEMERRRARICACPVTERDLGDGFLPATGIWERSIPLCIGSDSHCQIDAFTELRLIEYHERLRRTARVVLADDARPEPARWLLDVGGRQGHRAIGVDAGPIRVGSTFDAVALDLQHPSLIGVSDAGLESAAVFAADASAITDVWVAGQRVIADGEHAEAAAIEAEYVALVQRLFRS